MKKLFYLSCGFALLLAASCNKETPAPAPEPEPEDKAMNLSYEGTANCYLVYEAGDYSFDATVRGNGAVTEGMEKPEPLSPASASLVWETDKGMVSAVSFADGKIRFTYSGKPGNALVAAKDADGKIIWSWHIWCPEEEVLTYGMKSGYRVMNMNLGALASKFSAEPDVKPYGMLYQWGRKDPFPPAPTLTGDAQTVGATLYDAEGKELSIAHTSWTSAEENTLEFATANPTVCVASSALAATSQDWLAESVDALWGNPDGSFRDKATNTYPNKGAKSYYDPCPVGYRVPPADAFRTFTASGGYAWTVDSFDVADSNGDGTVDAEDFNYGWFFNVKSGNSLFFPAATRYYGAYGMLMGSMSGLWGNYWGNAAAEASYGKPGVAFCVLSFAKSPMTVSPAATAARADGMSVRCIKE